MRRPAQAVSVGQVWRDRDSRMNGRKVQVVSIEGDKAIVLEWFGGDRLGTPRRKLSLRRLRAGEGWELVA